MAQETNAEHEERQVGAARTALHELLPALRRLDGILEWATAAMNTRPGAPAADAPFRGLYISPEEAQAMLKREPGMPPFGAREEDPSTGAASPRSRLGWLKQAYALTDFEIDTIVIALAPELDLRYARLYAYLQDDVTRRFPTVELALNLLSSTAEEKLARHEAFLSDAPLLRNGLIRFQDDARSGDAVFLARAFRLDEQMVKLLLCQPGLDSRLAPATQVIDPVARLDDLVLDAATRSRLRGTVAAARQSGRSSVLFFEGLSGTGKSLAAEAIAVEAGITLLRLRLTRGSESKTDLRTLIQIALRDAWFHDAVLEITGLEALEGDDAASRWQELWTGLGEGNRGIVVLSGCNPPQLIGDRSRECLIVQFDLPDYESRRKLWERALTKNGFPLEPLPVKELAERFRLTPRQIEQAAGAAGTALRWQLAETRLVAQESHPLAAEEAPTPAEQESRRLAAVKQLYAAARQASSQPLAGLAHKIEPRHNWKQLVLPDESLQQLYDLCVHARGRSLVLGKWGFGDRLSTGKGLSALFGGPPGTGKTMAAEVIACELELDLYKINLANVVSKYIGETEKNLDRIFTAAENGNAILLFDEADAIFGRRSEVRDSHDRFANIEVAYLLQQMEEYEGISILATNLRQNLDPAFLRRLAFIIQFPFPQEEQRRLLWAGIWPDKAPLAPQLDFARLARDFKLSGANIKNIALAAAFLASESGGPVNMEHILRAVRREHQKLGRSFVDTELAGVAANVLLPSVGVA
jgi:AAA+ superfamily predicted ATPase